MQRTTDSHTEDLRAELARTRQQVADLSRRLDGLARAVRFSAGLHGRDDHRAGGAVLRLRAGWRTVGRHVDTERTGLPPANRQGDNQWPGRSCSSPGPGQHLQRRADND